MEGRSGPWRSLAGQPCITTLTSLNLCSLLDQIGMIVYNTFIIVTLQLKINEVHKAVSVVVGFMKASKALSCIQMPDLLAVKEVWLLWSVPEAGKDLIIGLLRPR